VRELLERGVRVGDGRLDLDERLLDGTVRMHERDLSEPLRGDPEQHAGTRAQTCRATGGHKRFQPWQPRSRRVAVDVAALGLGRRHDTESHERVVQFLEIARRGPGFTADTRNGLRIEPAKLGGLINTEITPSLHRQRAAFLSRCVIEKRVGLGTKHFLRKR
jgi:hypothetical protein